MTHSISRRAWLQRSAVAAAVLPVSRWFNPGMDFMPSPETGSDLIRLNSNENPYGPSDRAREAVIDSLRESNRYPRDYVARLKQAIAEREGLTDKHILITAGSAELLALTGLVYGLDKGELIAPHCTFDLMLQYAEKLGCKWNRIPLMSDMQQDLNAMQNAIHADTKLVFVCHPNNPTGVQLPSAQLRAFCEVNASRVPIYVDEAYIELCPDGRSASMINLVDQYPNIIIGRTFSKVFGLAGMRIGYAIAHPTTIEKLSDFHQGWNMSVSVMGCAAAMACLRDNAFEVFSKQKIEEGRKILTDAFDQWDVRYLPSTTNFVFYENAKFSEDPVQFLRKENILVRNYAHTPGWTRVSVGKPEELHKFLEVSGKMLS